MRPRWILSLLLLCSLAPIAMAISPAELLEIRLQADQAFDHGDFAEAAKLYEQLLPHQSENGKLLYNLAMAQYRSGNIAGAAKHIMPALEKGHGRKANIYYAIAQSEARQGNESSALRFLEMALADRLEDGADILEDDAFVSLHDDPEFQKLLGIPVEGLDRKAGWSHDLDFFLREVRRMHVDFDGYGFSKEIEQDIDALKGRIGELSDEEVAVELQRMIVKLGDGHSSLWRIPSDKVRFPSLPIKLYYFSDGFFVTDASDKYKHLVGAKLVSIGDKPADRLIDDLAPFCSRDNDTTIKGTAAAYAGRTAMLKMLGYSDHGEQAIVTFETTEGETHKITMAAERSHFDRRFGAPGGEVTEATAAWLREIGNRYWHREMPELNALYVQFNAVQDKEGGPSLAEYAATLRGILQQKGYRELIIDVRNNGGGNNFLIWPMVRTLIAHADASPDNRVWIATSRRTFSACQNFVNFADRILDPIFVGEPSGSKPNFIGESGRVKLQWSGLRMSISSRYWQDSFPNDHRQYIPMHMPVALSSADYFGNVDPVMQAIAEVLKNGAGNGGEAAE